MAGSTNKSGIDAIRAAPGNAFCVDCGTKDPEWAIINLGCLVCITCSGTHRSLGTHVSKVQSLTLDVKCWEGELLTFMTGIGNAAFNGVWEREVPHGTLLLRDFPEDEGLRETFIRDKYVHRIFHRCGSIPPPPLPAFRPLRGWVEKLSGRPIFASWQRRYLVFEHGEKLLQYFKTEDAPTPAGSIELEDCNVEIIYDCNAVGAPRGSHLWHIETRESKERKGSAFVFKVESLQECVRWVEAVRRVYLPTMADEEELEQGEMASFSCTIANFRDCADPDDWTRTGVLHVRDRLAWGAYRPRYVALSDVALYVYASATPPEQSGEPPVITIPLNEANIDPSPVGADHAGLIDKDEQSDAYPERMQVWGPLSGATIGFSATTEKSLWADAIKAAIAAAPPPGVAI